MSLANLSAAYEGMRRECKRWKYLGSKSEAELEELRSMLHQWLYARNPAARSYLLAVGRERQVLLEELSKTKEAVQRDH